MNRTRDPRRQGSGVLPGARVRGVGGRARAGAARLLLLVGISALAGVLVAGLALPLAGGAGLVARGSVESFDSLPATFTAPPLAQNSRVLAADGSVVATFYDQNRVLVPLSEVAPVMRQALVAIEDSRFYDHAGVDARGTVRALVNNTTGESVQGGSTITQQYVKNALVESALAQDDQAAAKAAVEQDGVAGYARKVRELRYSVALEEELSKDEILERYLNIAYFGNGAYGVEAAARTYFDKPAKSLRTAEAALLAGLVKNPSAYDPFGRPKAAQSRRDVVLARMGEVGFLPAGQVPAEQRRRLGLKRGETRTGCDTSYAPFFCDYVKRILLENPLFGRSPEDRQRLLFRGGITVTTTLDPKAQKAAERAVDSRVDETDKVAGVVVSLEPGTGRIPAMAVSRDFGDGKGKTQVNYAVDQAAGKSIGTLAGSTFKPFLAAEALEQGYGLDYRIHAPYKLKAKDTDGVTTCNGTLKNPDAQGKAYEPTNERRSENGIYTMREAMADSVNTYFLQLEKRTGLCEAAKRAEEMGVRRATGSRLEQNLSWTLGSDNVSPLRMAEAYATLAARGVHCTPVVITEVVGRDGTKLPVPEGTCEQVMEPQLADAVTYLLRGVMTEGTGAGSRLADRPAAGKTGTTNERRSAWFVGYTPELSTAVAVWNPTPPKGGYSMVSKRIGGRFYDKVQGANLPAPIWNDAMEGALEGTPVTSFVEPERRYFEGTKGPGDLVRPGGDLVRPGSKVLDEEDAEELLRRLFGNTAATRTSQPRAAAARPAAARPAATRPSASPARPAPRPAATPPPASDSGD
ncbi:MAG: penicillin-binding protein [Actinomycetota bacterium]|nr:penicillin-binding protein [Actinomycetota bacterium]